MKTNIFTLIVLTVMLMPAGQAFADTRQSATKLTADAALYTITYEFQTGAEPYYLPILAENGLPYDADSNKVGYTAVQNGKMSPTGYKSTGMVLSSYDIEDGYYVLPPMTKGSFTLVTALELLSLSSVRTVGLQITNLPYFRSEDKDRLVVAENNLRLFNTASVVLGTVKLTAPTTPSVMK